MEALSVAKCPACGNCGETSENPFNPKNPYGLSDDFISDPQLVLRVEYYAMILNVDLDIISNVYFFHIGLPIRFCNS